MEAESPDDCPPVSRRFGSILTYSYRGEGISAAWFSGRYYHDSDIVGAGTSLADEGRKIWWAQVKLKSGRLGWVNMNQSAFDGTCALSAPSPH